MDRLIKKFLKMAATWSPGNNLRIGFLRKCGYQIGADVYVAPGLIIADELEGDGYDVVIGNRASIGPRVTIVTVSSPNNSRLGEIIGTYRGKVAIGDDAWIGTGAILLPGITIGSMSIVGAGAVVTENVPPRSVAVGVPAKVVRRIEPENAT
jgi:acetyltransferase-like isoleucine patch superfamily enzyme